MLSLLPLLLLLTYAEGSFDPSKFDWDGWKVTLPVTGDDFYGDGSTAAAEVKPDGCTKELVFDEDLSIDYFWSDDEGLHFKVPLNLDGLTVNAHYIRSELRELHNWSPCDATDDSNWSYGGDHTLTSTLRIDKFDADSTTGVVVGQIHGFDVSYATIKVHYITDTNAVLVIYNSTPNSASPVFLDLGFVTGAEFWSYTIKMTDTHIELSAGGVTKTLTFGEELDNDWKDVLFYFKAGLYPQEPPSDDSTVIYEATFSQVDVSHENEDDNSEAEVATASISVGAVLAVIFAGILVLSLSVFVWHYKFRSKKVHREELGVPLQETPYTNMDEEQA